jgi:hypothetical protein
MTDLFTREVYEQSGDEVYDPGLHVELAPWGCHVLTQWLPGGGVMSQIPLSTLLNLLSDNVSGQSPCRTTGQGSYGCMATRNGGNSCTTRSPKGSAAQGGLLGGCHPGTSNESDC